jgi:hypothetical protein
LHSFSLSPLLPPERIGTAASQHLLFRCVILPLKPNILIKKTIESYLGTNGYAPSVYTAVSIAKALGVSVEYLVSGKEAKKDRPFSSLPKDTQEIVLASEQLKPKDRQIVLTLARSLKNR